MKLFTNANYRFIEARQKAYVVSAIVLLVGIAAMGRNVVTLGSWQNYGVDFLGGSLVQVAFDEPVTTAELRGALSSDNSLTITEFGGGDAHEFVMSQGWWRIAGEGAPGGALLFHSDPRLSRDPLRDAFRPRGGCCHRA
jgi:preprotein translocase subunit SecF